MIKREEKTHKKKAKNRGVWRSDNYQLQPSKKPTLPELTTAKGQIKKRKYNSRRPLDRLLSELFVVVLFVCFSSLPDIGRKLGIFRYILIPEIINKFMTNISESKAYACVQVKSQIKLEQKYTEKV
jgi:hypothetical protein